MNKPKRGREKSTFARKTSTIDVVEKKGWWGLEEGERQWVNQGRKDRGGVGWLSRSHHVQVITTWKGYMPPFSGRGRGAAENTPGENLTWGARLSSFGE